MVLTHQGDYNSPNNLVFKECIMKNLSSGKSKKNITITTIGQADKNPHPKSIIKFTDSIVGESNV